MSRRPARQRRDVDGQAVDAGNESVHLVNDPVHAAPESILDAFPDAGSRLADAVHGPVPGRSNPLHPGIHGIRHRPDGLFDILRNRIPVAPEEIQPCDEGSDDDKDGIGHRCCADCPDDRNHHPAHGQEGTAHAFGNNGDASRHRDESFELDSQVFRYAPGLADARGDGAERPEGPSAYRQHPAQGGTEELEGHDAESHLADQGLLLRRQGPEPGRQFLHPQGHGLEIRGERNRQVHPGILQLVHGNLHLLRRGQHLLIGFPGHAGRLGHLIHDLIEIPGSLACQNQDAVQSFDGTKELGHLFGITAGGPLHFVQELHPSYALQMSRVELKAKGLSQFRRFRRRLQDVAVSRLESRNGFARSDTVFGKDSDGAKEFLRSNVELGGNGDDVAHGLGHLAKGCLAEVLCQEHLVRHRRSLFCRFSIGIEDSRDTVYGSCRIREPGLGGDGHILDKAYSMAGIDTCRDGLVDRFRKVGNACPGFIADSTDLITDLLHGNDRRIHQGRNLGDATRKVTVQLEACRCGCQDGG